jgi:hypothetical protein
MDRIPPFQASSGERKDIRNLFKLISSGGNPYDHLETKDIYKNYKTIFDIFEISVDSRYGNLLHLPYQGGIVDQGSKTMDTLKYIQSLFRQKIIEEEKRKNNINH